MRTLDLRHLFRAAATPPTPAIKSSMLAGRLVAVGVLIAGMWLGPLQLVGTGLTHIPGDLVDNRFNHYVLEYGYRWASGSEKKFWHARFFYPARWMTAGSDSHLGTMPVYAGFRIAGADPERTFQLWYLTLSGLNYAGFYAAGRLLGLGRVGTAGGAFLYAFGLPGVGQLTHIQLVARFAAPLVFASAWRFLWRPSWGWALAAAGGLAVQTYANMYIGLFTSALVVGTCAITGVAFARSLPWRDLLRPGWAEVARRALALGVPAAAIIGLALPYWKVHRDHPPFPTEELYKLCPDVAAWVRPPVESVAWGWLRAALPDRADVPYVWEKVMFPGAAAYLGLLVGLGCAALLAFRRETVSPTIALAAVCTLVVLPVPFLLSDFGEWSPYRALMSVPGLSKLRASGRVILVLMIPLGICVAAGIDLLLNRVRAVGGTPGFIAAAGLALIFLFVDQAVKPVESGPESTPTYTAAESRTRRQAWADAIRREPSAKLVYLFPTHGTPDAELWIAQVDAMWGALEAGVPTVNGYTGYAPPGWFPFKNHCDLCHWLRTRGVLSEELLDGLVAFGEPRGEDDRPLERELRARCPTRAIPLVPR